MLTAVVLVLTGVTSREDVDMLDAPPNSVVENLGELVQLIN